MEVATNTKTDNEFRPNLLNALRAEFGQEILAWQATCDSIPTIWIERQNLLAFFFSDHVDLERILYHLKEILVVPIN